MKIRTLFIANSILATFFGLGFMLIPDYLFNLLGFSTAADGPLAMRFFGIAVFGIGVLTFSARDSEDSQARRAIILMLFVVYSLMPILHIGVQLILGKGNLMLWGVNVIHIVFAMAYGYFFFRKKQDLE
jgi:hypothetical protein